MSSGEQIKAARKRLKESQTAFGARLGVDQSVISRWEAKGPPNRGTAQAAIENLLAQIADVQSEAAE